MHDMKLFLFDVVHVWHVCFVVLLKFVNLVDQCIIIVVFITSACARRCNMENKTKPNDNKIVFVLEVGLVDVDCSQPCDIQKLE